MKILLVLLSAVGLYGQTFLPTPTYILPNAARTQSGTLIVLAADRASSLQIKANSISGVTAIGPITITGSNVTSSRIVLQPGTIFGDSWVEVGGAGILGNINGFQDLGRSATRWGNIWSMTENIGGSLNSTRLTVGQAGNGYAVDISSNTGSFPSLNVTNIGGTSSINATNTGGATITANCTSSCTKAFLSTSGAGDFLSLQIGGSTVINSSRFLNNITGVSQTLLPGAGSTYDLGSSGLPWNSLFVNNISSITSTGLQFSGNLTFNAGNTYDIGASGTTVRSIFSRTISASGNSGGATAANFINTGTLGGGSFSQGNGNGGSFDVTGGSGQPALLLNHSGITTGQVSFFVEKTAPAGVCVTGSVWVTSAGGAGTTLYVCEAAGWAAK